MQAADGVASGDAAVGKGSKAQNHGVDFQAALERERKLLLRLLRRRFGAEVDGEIERRVEIASVEQVEVWAERVLSAAALTELLADGTRPAHATRTAELRYR